MPGSRVKLRSSRGPIWLDARLSAATVMEKVVPATPMVAAATAPSTSRAPAVPPAYTQRSIQEGSVKAPSARTSNSDPTIAATVITAGRSQKEASRSAHHCRSRAVVIGAPR